jgi:integrase
MRTTKGTLYRRGGIFHAEWHHAGKRYRVSTGQSIRKDAAKRLAELVAPFAAGTEAALMEALAGRAAGRKVEAERLMDAATPPLRLADAWSAFAESPHRPDSGERTLAGYETHLAMFRGWLATAYPAAKRDAGSPAASSIEYMRDVTPAIAAEYVQSLAAAKVSASTFNQKRNFMRLLWRVLADKARAPVNPWDGIARRKLTALAFRKRELTPAQFDAVLAAAEADADVRDLLILLAWTGLRLHDGACLRWAAVDFARKVLNVTPRKTERRQGKQVHIPIFPAVAELLNRRQEGRALVGTAPVFPDLCEVYERDPSALSKRIAAVFLAAGLATTEERQGRARGVNVYGAHSLRHHFVSAAVAAGVPAGMIKSITGHATDEMVAHYSHIASDLAGEIAQKIGNGHIPAALPAPADANADGIRAKVRALATALNAGNIEKTRAALLAL